MSDQVARRDESVSPHTVFRPDSFFLKPFEGWGLTCDRRGNVLRKFTVEGGGRLDVRARSAWNEQRVTFDDERVDVMKWEIVGDDEGHFVGVEHEKNLRAEGELTAQGFCWRFRFHVPKIGTASMRVDYILISEGAAISRAVLKRLGFTLSTTSTFYRHR